MRGQRQTDHTALFLDVLGEIGEAELMVLEKIAAATRWVVEKERAGEKAEIEPFDYSAAEIMGLPPQEFRVALQSLIRKGLAFDDSFGRWGARAYTFARATDLGLRFLEWLGADHP